MAKFIISNGL